MKLTGKVAIVTGGAQGIGRAVAELFAGEGARVVIADCAEVCGQETERAIREAGGEAYFSCCDVTVEADIRRTVKDTVERYGGIDILVNDAAWQLNKDLLATTTAEFEQVMRTNVTGAFVFMREAAQQMVAQQRGGAMVNFSSTFAEVGSPGYFAYHASKGAVAAMTRAAAIALMPHHIRVNAVAPGTTETPGLHHGADDTGDHDRGMARFLALQPLGRFGRPEEIARVVLLLASDDASFMAGANVVVDGGYTVV